MDMTNSSTDPTTATPTTSRWRRLLPPHLVVLLLAVVVATSWIPLIDVVTWPWRLAGVAFVVAGGIINVGNAVRFEREQTNIVTFDDPTLLLTDGWFARTRNPMYLGFVLVLVGAAIVAGTLTAWIGPAVFFAAANWWYIPFEERRMRAAFGAAYDDYRHRVRRWL